MISRRIAHVQDYLPPAIGLGVDGFPPGVVDAPGLGDGFAVDFMEKTPSQDRMIRSEGLISHVPIDLDNEYSSSLILRKQIGAQWT